jgi:hypothetical protein
MMTRLIIYLLAMMTGFSAAEAARPVPATPASVGSAVGQVYADIVVNVAHRVQVRPLSDTPVSPALSIQVSDFAAYPAIALNTPVLRHDVILG